MKIKLLSTVLAASSTSALAQTDAGVEMGAAVGGIIGLLISVLIGAVIGWAASKIVKGNGSGFWTNVLIGIGGSLIAGHLFPALGISIGGAVGGFVAAVLGAVLLIVLVGLVRKSIK